MLSVGMFHAKVTDISYQISKSEFRDGASGHDMPSSLGEVAALSTISRASVSLLVLEPETYHKPSRSAPGGPAGYQSAKRGASRTLAARNFRKKRQVAGSCRATGLLPAIAGCFRVLVAGLSNPFTRRLAASACRKHTSARDMLHSHQPSLPSITHRS